MRNLIVTIPRVYAAVRKFRLMAVIKISVRVHVSREPRGSEHLEYFVPDTSPHDFSCMSSHPVVTRSTVFGSRHVFASKRTYKITSPSQLAVKNATRNTTSALTLEAHHSDVHIRTSSHRASFTQSPAHATRPKYPTSPWSTLPTVQRQ